MCLGGGAPGVCTSVTPLRQDDLGLSAKVTKLLAGVISPAQAIGRDWLWQKRAFSYGPAPSSTCWP